MRTLKYFFTVVFIVVGATAYAQNLKKEQRTQEKAIMTAYKHHKVTQNEYNKLMEEQDVIKTTIAKAEADGWTPHEKNSVNEKLERASRRLTRYEHNREKY